MAVQMELSRIIISELKDQQMIWLKEVGGERTFAILIGSNEAMAIDRRLKGIPMPRPLTHDLLAVTIEALGGTVEKIEITNLKDHTFFALIHIRQNGRVVQVDSRPSDAIALAMRCEAPVFIDESVFHKSGAYPQLSDEEQLRRTISGMDTVDFGLYYVN